MSLAITPRLLSISTPTACVSPLGWRASRNTVDASSKTSSRITAAPMISASPTSPSQLGAASPESSVELLGEFAGAHPELAVVHDPR